MAINKRTTKSGKASYTVQVSLPDASGGRGARVTIGTFRTMRLARKAEQDAQDQIEAGTFTLVPPEPPVVVTVADVVETWFTLKRREVTANSAAGYEAAIRLHLLPALGSRPARELTHDEIQGVVNGWEDAGTGAQTINRCMLVLRGALARQVRQGALPFNPASEIVKPSPKKRRELTIWTPEQATRFLRAADSDPLGPFWRLTLLEGLRRGEALGLRWTDIQWGDEEATAVAFIRQTVVADLTNGGQALVQSRAKTRASERAVDLTPPTVQALRAHRDRQRFQRQHVREVWDDSGLIVTNTLGGPLNPSNVRAHRERLIATAKVPRVTTHDLRHIAATVMLAAGTSPALVSRKIGHSSIQTTVDTYGHVAVSDQTAANAAIVAYLNRATGTDGDT